MDQFGFLVDEYHGFKSHDRSAPLSKLKQKPKHQPSYFTPSPPDTSSNTGVPSSSFDLDGFFTNQLQSKNYFGDNFGGSDGIGNFASSGSVASNSHDDLLGFSSGAGVKSNGNSGSVASNSHDGFPGFSSGAGLRSSGNSASVASNSYDDLLGLNGGGGVRSNGNSRSVASNSYNDLLGLNGGGGVRSSGNSGSVASNSYDDLLGLNNGVVHDDVFGILGANPAKTVDEKGSDEDLIPGFGVDAGDAKPRVPKKADPSPVPQQPSLFVDDDQFFAEDKAKDSKQGSLDHLDDFFNNQSKPPSQSPNIDDKWQKDNRKKATAQDSEFDFFSNPIKKPISPPEARTVKRAVPPSPVFSVPPPAAAAVKRAVTPSPVFNFWDDDTNSTEEFQEIDGEPRERREARLKRYLRTKERMDEALAVKNQRDLESQYEQEEKRRLAETLEKDIKRWVAGKEGNLRALLSSLQQVLWPECGWRPVSLTDMITSDAVKKVYRKATLYVHPDKVQQKGASLQQKYIAEKVFDILKEAWNKFSSEELR